MKFLGLLTAIALAASAADAEQSTASTIILVDGQRTLDGPTNYSEYAARTYHVQAKHPGSKLRMNLTSLNLASPFDTLMILDGFDEADPQLKSFHSDLSSIDIAWFSSTSNVSVIFKHAENSTVNSSIAFSIIFYELANGGLYKDGGDITLKTSKKADVFFLLEAKESNVVSFQLNDTQFLTVPSSQVMCYDGQSDAEPVVAYYASGVRSDYAAVSTQSYMYCVAQNFATNTTSLIATFSSVHLEANAYKFSRGGSDFYTVDLKSNDTSSWRILPEFVTNTMIQLSISKMTMPRCGKASVMIYDFGRTLLADLSENFEPFIIRTQSKSGFILESSVMNNDKSQTNCNLKLDASYTFDELVESADPMSSVGYIQSPNYPSAMPTELVKAWKVTIPEHKSAALFFDDSFNLDNNTLFMIYTREKFNNVTYLNITGGATTAPDNVYITNNSPNSSLVFTVYINTVSYQVPTAPSKFTGFRLMYSTKIDKTEVMSYNTSTPKIPTLSAPDVTVAAGEKYYAAWRVEVPRGNSAGNLNVINMNIDFMNKKNVSGLVVYDGGRKDSPIIYSTESKIHTLTAEKPMSINSTSNIVGIMYSINNDQANETMGDNFTMSFKVLGCNVCNVSLTGANDEVTVACIKEEWRCDGLYQCIDGLDEKDCAPQPTTKPPPAPVTKEGARWWVVAVVAIATFIIGIIATIVGAMCIAKRRGSSFTRLRDMMAPVPT